MKYLRTDLATAWPENEDWKEKLLGRLLFFIPKANPGYQKKMHLVKEWLIEFDDNNAPLREIGIGSNGTPVLAGPDSENYGFWCDTNMSFDDFKGELIGREEFDSLWEQSGVTSIITHAPTDRRGDVG